MSWCRCLSCPKTEVEDITTLDLSSNCLVEVPSMVFNFERTLQYLHLDCNKIVELPRTLFQCEELRYLGLSDNEVETIPPLIEKLANLESLSLTRNCLSCESIPSNMHRCQRLRILHLSSNNLTKVPSSITRLICLRELYLNNCDLEFLPANFGRLNNLRILELRDNHLSALPKSLKRLSNLCRLDISSNVFKNFPDIIGNMSNLTELWMNDNYIIGIPDCIGSLCKLTHLDVSSNRLEKISDYIELCSSITLLILSMNDLKELPLTIVNMVQLHILKIDHNLLEWLPDNIGKLVNLEELDVQFNNIKSFPNSIGMLRKLNSFVAAQNSLVHLPGEIGSCNALSVLSLHCNKLTHLPEEIGHLQNLTTISLINNRLQYLPLTVLSLRRLKALWLSHIQNQPLIALQKEILENGHVVLTCVFLPQVEVPSHTSPVVHVPAHSQSSRRIGFKDTNVNDLPVKLTRIPTPHPKAFVKYQRIMENTLKRHQKNVPPNISAVDAIYIKEANVVPMKNVGDEREACTVMIAEDNDGSRCKSVRYDSDEKNVMLTPNNRVVQKNSVNEKEDKYGELRKTQNTCGAFLNEGEITKLEKLQSSNSTPDYISESDRLTWLKEKKPTRPPPYHVAAIYSKEAHLFFEQGEKKTELKYFTQDRPLNVLNPYPKHANCISPLWSGSRDLVADGSEYYEYNFNLDFCERVLNVVSKLLQLDMKDENCFACIEQFIQFEKTNDEFDSKSSKIHTKLKIMNTALHLIYSKNHHVDDNVLQIIDNLYKNLTVANVAENIFNKDSRNIVKDQFALINMVAFLLQGYQNGESHLKTQILYAYMKECAFKTPLSTEREALIMVKLKLIKFVIYFLTTNNEKECTYILDMFLQIHNQMRDSFQSVQNEKDMKRLRESVSKNQNETFQQRNNRQIDNDVYGAHQRSRILKVQLTPCCYVLGFSISHTHEGVFINEVDENGNAFKKLFTGDKILMLDDRDISKLDPEEALKAVHIWGPETETFLICRS